MARIWAPALPLPWRVQVVSLPTSREEKLVATDAVQSHGCRVSFSPILAAASNPGVAMWFGLDTEMEEQFDLNEIVVTTKVEA